MKAPLPPTDRCGRARVMILDVQPRLEGGRFLVKSIVGEPVCVSADLLVDGHDKLAGVLRYRKTESAGNDGNWTEERLVPGGQETDARSHRDTAPNDRWEGTFVPDAPGIWEFCLEAWVDEFASWRWGFTRKIAAGQNVALARTEGALLLSQAAARAVGPDRAFIEATATSLRQGSHGPEELVALCHDPVLAGHMHRYTDRSASTYSAPLGLWVDPPKARFSAWYELFPRSFGADGTHGTFTDVVGLLPYVADMGFDVLYLPPIHPIGRTHRKGPNNTLHAGPDDPGSPWAIGAETGGHKEVHPALGTVDDFESLVEAARTLGIDVAIDIAFQASPDHPYVGEHPEWFLHRPDGTIQHAENPPKAYQDVYPFAFAGPAWQPLWQELLDVFLVWIARGVRVFRVDNPHTKPLPFWQWCLGEIKQRHPEVLFLSEAFTRPKLMYALAQVGFTQSYTYFTWRTSAWELRTYMNELTSPPVSTYFRPNFWPNTPDILPEHLQHGGPGTFAARVILAATLAANYGLYGPAYELQERVARPGSEEYLDNEKFQLRRWDLFRKDSLRPLIKRLNQIRRDNPALHRNEGLVFHESDNEKLLAYSKSSADGDNLILTVVNLDGHHKQAGWITLDAHALRLAPHEPVQAHDLLSDARYLWHGPRAYVELDPDALPAQVFRLRRRLRSEASFEYYL